MFEKGFLIYVFTTLEAIEKIKIYIKEIYSPEELLLLNDHKNPGLKSEAAMETLFPFYSPLHLFSQSLNHR